MTPEEVFYTILYADREFGRDSWGYRTVKNLTDALTAAWAERDALVKLHDRECGGPKGTAELRERAERAEAALAVFDIREFERMHDALARVRALCDRRRTESPGAGWALVTDILAAMEGEK